MIFPDIWLKPTNNIIGRTFGSTINNLHWQVLRLIRAEALLMVFAPEQRFPTSLLLAPWPSLWAYQPRGSET